MDSQSGVWGPHFQLSRFLVPFKITDLHLRVSRPKPSPLFPKGLTMKRTFHAQHEIRNSHVHVMLSMVTVHCATMRHQQQSNTLHAVAPADFYGGFGADQTCPNTHLIIFSWRIWHLPDMYAFFENEQRGNASLRRWGLLLLEALQLTRPGSTSIWHKLTKEGHINVSKK